MRYLFLFLCIGLAGCAGNPFSGLSRPPSEPRKLASWSQTEKQVPYYLVSTVDGKERIVYQTERSYSASSQETPEKLSFMQRLGRWISGLSIIAIIFIIGSLAFLGGAPLVWLARRYFAMKSAFVNTIEAIERMKAIEKEKLKVLLLQEHDKRDTELITRLKVHEVAPRGPMPNDGMNLLELNVMQPVKERG